MIIRALILDFDGLILDTESPDYQSWRETFEAHGCSLPLLEWARYVGNLDHTFDPYAWLEQQLGRPVDRTAVRARRRARYAELMAHESLRPGVEDYLLEARRLGLRLGIASSAPRSWIASHLAALGLAGGFDSVKCADDVECAKPDPAVYRLPCRRWERKRTRRSCSRIRPMGSWQPNALACSAWPYRTG